LIKASPRNVSEKLLAEERKKKNNNNKAKKMKNTKIIIAGYSPNRN
jgi:hypothetical protein